ncbi:MAG TPA: hypothetical protein VJ890_21250 [Vineibacter sp.]|nr:hypothetical protein [Vineibacter sp.]
MNGSDTAAIWQRLQQHEAAMAADREQLQRHLGECTVRHAEIIRRQDDSSRERAQIGSDVSALSKALNDAQVRILIGALSALGSAVLAGVSIVVMLLKR